MKSKKFISGLLAGAMVLTSVATFGVSEAEAAGEDGLVASYSFENGLANDVGTDGDAAVTVGKGITEYTGSPAYETGRNGQAIRLNDNYGLKLNQENLGDNFTVSLWVKPDGILKENEVIAFLGYNNPEQWVAFSGGTLNGGSSELCKFWANGNGYGTHTTLGTTNVNTDWHKVTITGTDSTMTAYVDGIQIGSGDTNHPLAQENGDIYIGVNFWQDMIFRGLVDDVKVYNTTASAEEVQKDYLRDIGEPEGFKVASYSFEDGLVNDEGAETDTASAIVTGLNSYNGEVDYDENGFKGSAIRLGDYGLKLNKENLGENFSVSMWLNSDSTFPENQVLMFLGYHDPQKWIAVSGGEPGNGNSSLVKFWGKDDSVYTSHTTLSTTNIPAGSWHQLTVTGSEDTLTAYLDGEAIAYASGQNGASNHPLAGENQDIYIGVNYWDTEFEGLVDEIEVYDCTLSADYIKEAYDAAYSNPEDFKTGYWSFENGLANDEGGDGASAIITGLGTYEGNITYDENGFDGKAVRLGDYGLDLNQDNLGENFSVSMWVKPDGTYLENQVLALLGYHADPENWIAVAGNRTGSSECKFWANGGNYNTWTTLGTPSVNADGWHQLVITGSEDTVTAYLDGQSVGSGASNHPLNRADGNGKIYIGVNYWNDEFSGLVDEIEVYRYTLSAEDIAAAYAEATADPKEGKIAEYTFEESIADNNGAEASAVVTGLGAYSGDVKYEAGFRGEAVRLGDYGLQLNKKNIGENFTVSMWVKPDGTFAENQVLTLLGYHNPEQWLAVSGNKSGTSQCKFWANGGTYGTWTTLGTPSVNSDGWHQLVITGTASTVTAYLDGVQVGSGTSNHPLAQENGDIYLGVNNWDNEFSGLMDDVEIYGEALTAGEISRIYEEDLLAADRENLTVPTEVKWDMTLPTAGNSGQTTITWSSDNTAIDADTGKVTRPENGQGNAQVNLTATIKTGEASVVKTFTVTVLAKDPDSDIDDYADWLSLNAGFVSADLSLPQTVGEAAVAWSSSDPAIAINGTDAKVTRPDGENKAVTLTATVSLDGTTKTVIKEFPLTVLADGPDLLTYISNAPATGQNGGMKIAGESEGSYSVLHSNQPILYASKGTKSLSSAQIFRAADGSFGVVAADGGNNGNLVLFDSEDLITYSNERMISVPGVSAIKEVNCVYDSADKVYRIFIKDGNDKVWMAESADLTAIDSVAASDYSFQSVTGAPDDAVNPWTAALTQAEYDAVVKKFSSIQNTGVTAPEDIEVTEGEEVELPETVTAQYSDGSTKQLGVVWDEEDLANVGSNGAGEYTVEGTVQRTISYTDPEEPLIEERADPFMTYDAERGKYYFTGSYPTNGKGGADGYDRLVIREADTIDGLQTAQETVIWDESWDDGSGNAYSQWIWAPEIHKIGDSWYIISTAGTNGGDRFGTLRPFMMRCNNPDDITNPDSWDAPERVKPMAGDERNCLNAMSLDMTYFEADGTSYLAWADFTQTGISSIYIATIDPSNPTQLTSPCTIISRPEYSWEYVRATVNEGPAVFKSNGKVYMAFSASGTGSEYCVGLLTANEGEDLLDADSWVKSNYPVLTSTDFNDEVSGPGHNSFTVDEYGNVIIVYHARPAEIHSGHGGDPLQDPCRYAYLQPVNIAADGSPVLNMTPEQELADEYAKVMVTVNVKADALTGIEVTKDPAKLSYKVGDTFDPAGIEVKATFQSGATKTLGADAEGLTFSPAEFTEAGDQMVVVSYTVGQITFTDSIAVTVSEQTTEPEEPEVVADSAVVKTQPARTEYTAGEKFDAAGLVVTVELDNGETADYTLAELADLVITPETLAEDTEAVTLSFTVDGAKQSVTVAVTVEPEQTTEPEEPEVVADSAVVKTQPAKTEYKAGEKFDAAGLVVTVELDNGETADYTLAELADLVITPETLAEDTEAVTLTFTVDGVEQSVTVAVDVKPADGTDTDDGNGGGTTPPADDTDNDDLKDEPKNEPKDEPADVQDGGAAVQTGDTTNILPAAAVMIFALAGAAAVVILKTRKRG